MKVFVVVALLSSVLAAPTNLEAHWVSGLCNGGLLYTSPSCCSTSILDIASLDCSVPNKSPNAMNSFRSICGAMNKSPKCCTIPLAGLAILCTDPIGA
ncbi:fungal hydrophobin domain-containing protein [Hirsutella rhossiliensis]|uniref:Fungal hydrophobin domain-containing protein n=1 Tax=Hirsutella rhossiliensis TaxID=111463 RepID=A0A9P8MZB9_9HYPO|nr:fungal hydrophobin domain-containing protein [Hirsutella rhossiliensis]KAH0964813.1 fungal hydrophobin domain-containing protein [Hirsutella rhossiliensis]